MTKIFEPRIRDQAVETTCSNLLTATVLQPEEVAMLMSQMTGYSDIDLARILITSRMLLDTYLENCRGRN